MTNLAPKSDSTSGSKEDSGNENLGSGGTQPLKLNVVDMTQQRLDLARRKELKFVVSGVDTDRLRDILSLSCTPVKHNNKVSVVRSIYFDDFALSACNANIKGLGSRQKLRVRWYDQLRPGKRFYVEIKWRDNRVTGKHRLEVDSSVDLSEVSYRDFKRALLDQLPDNLKPFVHRFSDPVVLVEYNRQHFVSLDQTVRLTIDYDLGFYSQVGKRRVSTNLAFRKPIIVVEAKVSVGSEKAIKQILKPLRTRIGKCSKYVHGCHAIGLIHEV